MYSESGDAWGKLEGLKDYYITSSGMSEDFGYFPIIFIKDKAFSGFNDDIKKQIDQLVHENDTQATTEENSKK